MRIPAAAALAALALALPQHPAAQPKDSVFPLFYDRVGSRPIEIVATKTWGAQAEEPKEGPKNVSSSSKPDAPLGPMSLLVGEVRAAEGKGPIKLVLDYAGFEQKPTRSGDRDHWIVFNMTLVCPYVEGACHKPGDLKANLKTDFQKLFEAAPQMLNSMARSEVQVGSAKRTLLLGQDYFEYDLKPNALVRVFVSFNAPGHIETHQVRATLLYGDYATQPPAQAKPGRRPLGINFAGKLAALLALIAFGWLWLRKHTASLEDPQEDAPRLLGSLVATFGLALAVAGLTANALYYLVVGGLIAYSGLFFHFGRPIARALYGLALVLVWGWSIVEVGADAKAIGMRVTLPTLIAIYLFSGAVSSRLARD